MSLALLYVLTVNSVLPGWNNNSVKVQNCQLGFCNGAGDKEESHRCSGEDGGIEGIGTV